MSRNLDSTASASIWYLKNKKEKENKKNLSEKIGNINFIWEGIIKII